MPQPEAPPTPPVRPMRIAAVGARGIPSNYSGIERIWSDLYPYLAARGHQITCYCRPGVIEGETGEHAGVRLVTTGAPGGRSAETLSHSWTALRHALRRGDVHDGGRPFDLIALHALPPQMFAALPMRHGVPLVSHVHGLDWQREKWRRTPLGIGSRVIRAAERRMVRYADDIAVCATGLVDYFRDTYGRDTHFIPNGVMPCDENFEPDAATLRSFGLSAGGFVVCVGRLVREKRVEDAVAAFLRLKSQFPHTQRMAAAKFVVVGEGPPGGYVESLRALGGEHVVFAGLQRGVALEALFRAAAAYVTASEMEGLPSSLLECMEYATPAVASAIPPHRQLLGGVDGYDLFADVGDVDGLARQLGRVLLDPDRAARVGAAQRRFVRANYSWPVLAERTEHLYGEAIARHAVRVGGPATLGLQCPTAPSSPPPSPLPSRWPAFS